MFHFVSLTVWPPPPPQQQPTCDFQTFAPSEHRDKKKNLKQLIVVLTQTGRYFRGMPFMQSTRDGGRRAHLHKQRLGCDLFPLIMHSWFMRSIKLLWIVICFCIQYTVEKNKEKNTSCLSAQNIFIFLFFWACYATLSYTSISNSVWHYKNNLCTICSLVFGPKHHNEDINCSSSTFGEGGEQLCVNSVRTPALKSSAVWRQNVTQNSLC